MKDISSKKDAFKERCKVIFICSKEILFSVKSCLTRNERSNLYLTTKIVTVGGCVNSKEGGEIEKASSEDLVAGGGGQV